MCETIVLSTAGLIMAEGLQIQVDNVSVQQALIGDAELTTYKIVIDLARKKNKYGNPVAEKAVQEFKKEKLKHKPSRGSITELEQVLITVSMNRLV